MRLAMLATLSLLLAPAAMAQTRYPPLNPAAMTAAQKSMYDAIMAGPRHSIEGPFNAWLRSPELGERLQRVGEYLRFDTSIPHKLNEFAILITGAEWRCGLEWYLHYPLAIKAGLEPSVAAAVQDGSRPDGMTADETTVYDFATQLHRQHQVSDAVYRDALARFGEQGITDLIAVLGYYNTVSMTLNVAQVQAPTDAGKIFPALPQALQ